eukprot:TRINITY_DN1647_c0_g1_i2.p1 TRINITY_DN1647_c0_g1~~TRINITY_DN1647_c0_g1_i2.p1  ORF type:complete len:252 (-),score=45.92 TRINITY_DN1647_c0_g1_i2:141-896(-)
MSQQIQDWFNGLPPVSRFVVTAFGATAFLAHFNIVPFGKIVFDWVDITSRFEIWRLITPFFVIGKLDLNFLIYFMYIVRYLPTLETESYNGDTAKFVFALGCISSVIMVAVVYLGGAFFGHSLVFAIIYLWSRYYPNINMTFMFGFQFISAYFPWVLIGFTYLMGANPVLPIVGVVSAHLFYYLDRELPTKTGRTYINVPGFLYNYFPRQRGAVHGVYGTVPPRQTAQATTANTGPLPWGSRGQGRVLGSE